MWYQERIYQYQFAGSCVCVYVNCVVSQLIVYNQICCWMINLNEQLVLSAVNDNTVMV